MNFTINFLKSEFLKLKGSKTFICSLVAAFIPSLFTSFVFLTYAIEDPSFTISFFEMFDQTNIFSLGLISIIVFPMIIAFLFNKEHEEHTLKLIISVPVSKNSYLFGKYLMFLIWTIIFSILSFIGALLCGLIIGANEFSFYICLSFLVRFLFGSILLYLAMSPLIFLLLWLKSTFSILIVSILIMIANILLFNLDNAYLFPWLIPAILSSTNRLIDISLFTFEPYLIIFIVFLISFSLSLLYFNKKDIPL